MSYKYGNFNSDDKDNILKPEGTRKSNERLSQQQIFGCNLKFFDRLKIS